MSRLAGIVVMAAGLWLVALAALVAVAPARAARLLGAFASSARAHYLEQVLRLVAGAALVVHAAEMRFPDFFRLFGWILVATAAALLVLPWRWHRRFGRWAIPLALRHLRLLALGAFALGALILYAAA